ncbi:hypothetical protein SAMN04490248_10233 [Salinihabitans flavidus]|uniref:Twin-arginine translocation pathway signal n=1 Tax=Salinihabitans flavidus TaxID=569882 RepID=A0A1H8MDE1_9RHOB|nr:DUF1513 domain-containing protein [Salinihabitans flavidus]SEO15280.1 hypothetical protein SAMN04490248_10233 [Salinihabitans flavidus]
MSTRREFMTALAAASALPSLSWADAGSPAFLAAAREPDGTYALFGLDRTGADVLRIPLPDRGHAAAAHPRMPEAVAIARRPGTFAMVIDCATGRLLHRLNAPAGRHLYGHGAFIEEGAVLCTTENDIETGEGRIGLWARDAGYRRIGEIPSGGIGPHEIIALPGDVLAVANGGIRTHPDNGREKQNLDTMHPNLSYVTLAGGVKESVALGPELHKASIRHLAAGDGVVAFAMQWQGPMPDPAPLLGFHRLGGAPVLCAADLTEQIAMDGYAGSVAIAGGRAAITSPRGGRVHIYSLEGDFLATLRRRDVCGIAPDGANFVLTDGMGGIFSTIRTTLRLERRAERAWDNHLVRIGG